MEINGNKYKTCIGWRAFAGYGEMCIDLCSSVQREACSTQQEDDNEQEKAEENDIKEETFWK